MSAILSEDALNDFISPGVACIKPIETLPKQQPDDSNPYEVTTEDKVAASNPPPAEISLTDCLACSGCVTSAEAVLVSLQSHNEVLRTLDAHPSLRPETWAYLRSQGNGINGNSLPSEGKIFVASVSPQTRASLAATYGISERAAGHQIQQLLSGPQGLSSGGNNGSSFAWVIDTNVMREAALVLAAEEVASALRSQAESYDMREGDINTKPMKPILTSACPGWICYAEKTHPYILPHLSRLKSPQALTGTMVKSVLYKKFGIPPEKVWHMAVMPCFDKKLEASRSELTSIAWAPDSLEAVRDVDCVITARELLNLAENRGISFPSLPRRPLSTSERIPFPDAALDRFLFPPPRRRAAHTLHSPSEAGPSGGYLWHILQTYKSQHPGSRIKIERGRNVDVMEYRLIQDTDHGPKTIFRAARYYGFRNIQNLVRRLKPAKASKLPGAASRKPGGSRKPGQPAGSGKDDQYAYVEVMACPGGCTNGGGQIKVSDLREVQGEEFENSGAQKVGTGEQRKWLERVDEAYFSAGSSDEDEGELTNGHDQMESHGRALGDATDVDQPHANGINGVNGHHDEDMVDGISHGKIDSMVQYWANLTDVDAQTLCYTSFRKVESDVGKNATEVERVAGLASSIGGGW